MINTVSHSDDETRLKKFDNFLGCWNYNTQMHLWRYVFAAEFVNGKVIIDVSSGVGYGSNYLSKMGVRQVLGVDLDENPLDYAQASYKHINLSFIQGDGLTLPVADNSIDVVCSFETIEHIPVGFQEKLVVEASRVLKPGGVFLCSTPNHEYSPGHVEHTKEFMPDELFELMSPYFGRVEPYGQYITHDDLQFQQAQVRTLKFQIRRKKGVLFQKLRNWLQQTPTRIQVREMIKKLLGKDNQTREYAKPEYISETLVNSLDKTYGPIPVKEDNSGILFGLLAICYK